MSKSSSIHDEERRLEQIVAYLDGELSPVETSLVERQLAEDADFRQELQSIERAWSALDALPTTKVDKRFSKTTMEFVVGEARQELLQKTLALPVQRRKNWLGKLLLATAGAALGLLMIRLVRENPNRVLLTDLPVIHYIDVYSQFREVDFLQRLHEEVGDDVWVADLTPEDFAAQEDQFKSIVDAAQRRDWINQLDEQDQATLRAQYNRFMSLSPQEQVRLRSLHDELISAPDSENLQRTMLQYQAWLNTLPASRQFELREKAVVDRVREVVNQVRREADNPWISLSPDELGRLDRALMPIRDQLFREIPPQERTGRDRNLTFGQEIRRQFVQHREEWLPKIINALSPESRAKFESLSTAEQQRQVGRWIVDLRAWEGGPRRGRQRFEEVSQQELERFFVEDTDAATKERLLSQPRDKMEQQLKRMYFQNEFGSDQFPHEDRPFGPPPRGDRGGFGPRRGPGFGPPGNRPEGGPPDGPDFGRPPEEFRPPRGERNFDRPPPPPSE